MLGVVAPASALAACAPSPTTGANAKPSTTPRGTPSSSTNVAPGSLPSVIRSYGPNGTHWPSTTPWIGESVAKVVDVACTWEAIGAAIAAVTPEEAASGVHIKVSPGTLPGLGASSGSKNVLETLGSADWPRNVLVSPADGWGTVTISDPARLTDVAGVTFARINGTDILLTNCNRTAWAHCEGQQGPADDVVLWRDDS